MKLLTLIVHTNVQQSLSNLLHTMDQVTGFSFSKVEGHGSEKENDPYLLARDEVVGSIPRIQVDILLEDSDVEGVLSRLRDKDNNVTGQGAYWVVPVEKGGHIL
jgi:nitrogen regulatory protein P-II 1